MGRKFVTVKELAFISKINHELIQKVVGQSVTYWAVLADKTKTNDLYNEAIEKIWSVPTHTNCLVFYENTSEQIGSLPPDAKFNIDVYFHVDELRERNLQPRMGDFVQFGEVIYEILSATQPQIIFGQIDQKMMMKCPCMPARKGQFNPPKQPSPTPTPDSNSPIYD